VGSGCAVLHKGSGGVDAASDDAAGPGATGEEAVPEEGDTVVIVSVSAAGAGLSPRNAAHIAAASTSAASTP
jgi:hypothetical protein